MRKILAELAVLDGEQLLLVQVHLAFLMQLFDGYHTVQVRLRHLVVRVGRDGPKELRISIDELVVQLALTNCLLKQLVFRQLVQRLVRQQVLVRLPYLFQLLMVRLVRFQVAREDRLRNRTRAVMLVLDCCRTLLFFESVAFKGWR